MKVFGALKAKAGRPIEQAMGDYLITLLAAAIVAIAAATIAAATAYAAYHAAANLKYERNLEEPTSVARWHAQDPSTPLRSARDDSTKRTNAVIPSPSARLRVNSARNLMQLASVETPEQQLARRSWGHEKITGSERGEGSHTIEA